MRWRDPGDVLRRRWIGTLLLGVVAALAVPGAAFAADPPEVTGLPLAAVEKALRAWDQNVLISYVPSLKELPTGTDPATLVAAGRQWLNPEPIDTTPPQVQVQLGAVVPDLRGLTQAGATAVLTPLGLRATGLPQNADAAWVTANQRPPAGAIAPLTSPVTLILAAPVTSAPTPAPTLVAEPPARRPFGPAAVAGVVSGGLLLVALAALLTARARRGRRLPAPAVELRGHPGQVLGPQLIEAPHGQSVSVRLVPRTGPAEPVVKVEERG